MLQTVVHVFLVCWFRIQPQHPEGISVVQRCPYEGQPVWISVVLMLCYDNLNSHVTIPSLALASCFKTLEVFESSLCKSPWSQRGRWKILFGVSHDVKVQVYNYLKEKWRSWKYVVCFTDSKVLLVVLKRARDTLPLSDTRRWHVWRRTMWSLSQLRDRVFQLSDCKHGQSLCERSNGHKYLRKTSVPGT